MANLILTTDDAGITIPISVGPVYKVWGAAGTQVDILSIAAGASATIYTSGGNDQYILAGSPLDYTVKRSGSFTTNMEFTHTSTGKTVTVYVNTEADTLKFTTGETAAIRIESGLVKLGIQTVTTTASAITGTGGSTDFTDLAVDGKGTVGGTAATLDASLAKYNFTENVKLDNNVIITNFSADDKITVTGATSVNYDTSIATTTSTLKPGTGDVNINYQDSTGHINTIVLVGVVTDITNLVYSVKTFNDLGLGQLTFV